MRKNLIVIAIAFVALVIGAGVTFTARSADMAGSEATIGDPIDGIMSKVVQGRIDDALASIDFLKTQPDTRFALRDKLVQLMNQQQHCYGYDVAAVQRLSSRLEVVSVLAYYEQQPILFQFELYRPQGRSDEAWLIQSLSLHIDVMEQLKDTPVDYVARRNASGRQ